MKEKKYTSILNSINLVLFKLFINKPHTIFGLGKPLGKRNSSILYIVHTHILMISNCFLSWPIKSISRKVCVFLCILVIY